MRVFHLAIPTHDLDQAEFFYVKIIGAKKARRYDDRVTFCFFDHQIVCHLAPEEIAHEVKMYPRHFGITFLLKADFEKIHNNCKLSEHPFYQDRFIRWPEKEEKHEAFFIADLSNNLLEFKYYYDSKFVF